MQARQRIRAFNPTGHCTSCGAYERTCPMDIQMSYLTDKLNLDMANTYQFEVGMDAETQPPCATLTLDDKNRFTAQGNKP
jgi:L-lactate utilization protein LutB